MLRLQFHLRVGLIQRLLHLLLQLVLGAGDLFFEVDVRRQHLALLQDAQQRFLADHVLHVELQHRRDLVAVEQPVLVILGDGDLRLFHAGVGRGDADDLLDGAG